MHGEIIERFADLLFDEIEIMMITFSKLYSPTRTLRSEALNLATQKNVNSRQKSDVGIDHLSVCWLFLLTIYPLFCLYIFTIDQHSSYR